MGVGGLFPWLLHTPGSHPLVWSPQLSGAVTSVCMSDEAILGTMRRCWEENQYFLCPHTAVAVSAHYQQTDKQQLRYGDVPLGAQRLTSKFRRLHIAPWF